MFSQNQKQKVTQHLIFLTVSILQQKKSENFGKIWVIVDAGYVLFKYFYFIAVISTFDTTSCVFLKIRNQVAKGLT